MRKTVHSSQYQVLLDLLIAARERAKVTQIGLASSLKMTQSAVSKVERGERRLDAIELYAWCKGLGISFKEFTAELDRKLGR